VLPYLSVVDNVAFSSAMHNKHDRKLLLKSYKGAHLPAFDRYVYTDANNFAVARWVMKKGVDVRGMRLHLHGEGLPDGVLTEAGAVLLQLLQGKKKYHKKLAAWFATRSAEPITETTEKETGKSSLYLACKCGLLNVVQVLLEKGADIHKTDNLGLTPLHSACYQGHLEVVLLLLEKGADINTASSRGTTPLRLAQKKKHCMVVHELELAAQI
jgi:hypothetical protein